MNITNYYFKEINTYNLLTEAEEKNYLSDYALALNNNDKEKAMAIRNDIVNSNQRLVVAVAKKYVGRKIELLDLIQEGNMGLMKAIDKFDISMGNRFSTYAVYWIKEAIEEALKQQANTIRIPNYLNKILTRINKEKSELMAELKREPSNEELAVKVDIPVNKLEEYMSYSMGMYSLDGKISDKNTPVNCIGTKILSPDKVYFKNRKKKEIRSIIDKLPYKEKTVILMRYGLNREKKVYTLENIASLFNVSAVSVHKYETNAVNMLRKSIEEDYIYN